MMSQMTPFKTIRMTLVSAIFRQFVLDFLTLQDKHNITYIVVKYKINLHFAVKQARKTAFLPVSEACTNKFYIFRQCTYIVYIYIYKPYQKSLIV